jgi:hypothetical protein
VGSAVRMDCYLSRGVSRVGPSALRIVCEQPRGRSGKAHLDGGGSMHGQPRPQGLPGTRPPDRILANSRGDVFEDGPMFQIRSLPFLEHFPAPKSIPPEDVGGGLWSLLTGLTQRTPQIYFSLSVPTTAAIAGYRDGDLRLRPNSRCPRRPHKPESYDSRILRTDP